MPTPRWPPIPRQIEGLAGPIRVVVRRGVESFKARDGDDCLGLYQPTKRRIDIAGKVPPALRFHTLFHEFAHAWMIDAGIQNLLHGDAAQVERTQEVICDTLATVMVRAWVGSSKLDPFAGAKR